MPERAVQLVEVVNRIKWMALPGKSLGVDRRWDDRFEQCIDVSDLDAHLGSGLAGHPVGR
jgi:hypothetical protein